MTIDHDSDSIRTEEAEFLKMLRPRVVFPIHHGNEEYILKRMRFSDTYEARNVRSQTANACIRTGKNIPPINLLPQDIFHQVRVP